ncbi:MAG: MaoC family dehydratase [Rubrimonas sp.]
MRWFEDFTPGLVIETGGATLTEAAILDFALTWDFQPFHIDVEAAADGPYGGIIASGFHTLVTGFRLFLTEAGMRDSSMGSPGIEDLKWLRPVRPGDTIRVRAEVVSARPSASKPDRGIATMDFAMTNQRGETVLTYRSAIIFRKRPA